MDDFYDLKKLVAAQPVKPKTISFGVCPQCDYKSYNLDNFDQETETESWEMPWIVYTVFICRKCGSDEVEVQRHTVHRYCQNCNRRVPSKSRCKCGHRHAYPIYG
jgi:hypothetical protein